MLSFLFGLSVGIMLERGEEIWGFHARWSHAAKMMKKYQKKIWILVRAYIPTAFELRIVWIRWTLVTYTNYVCTDAYRPGWESNKIAPTGVFLHSPPSGHALHYSYSGLRCVTPHQTTSSLEQNSLKFESSWIRSSVVRYKMCKTYSVWIWFIDLVWLS